MNPNTTNLLNQSDAFVSRDDRVAFDELTGGSSWDGGGTTIIPEDIDTGENKAGGGGNGHADGSAPDGGRGGDEKNEDTWEEYLKRFQSKASKEKEDSTKKSPLLLVAALAILVISLK